MQKDLHMLCLHTEFYWQARAYIKETGEQKDKQQSASMNKHCPHTCLQNDNNFK